MLPSCLAERLHVVLGTEQPRLLGTPEREAHPVGRLYAELGHLQGDLEDGG